MTREHIEKTIPGFNWLDKVTESFTILEENVLDVDKQTFDDFWAVGMTFRPTPNPYDASSTLKRRQGTYGAELSFAGQVSYATGGDDKTKWPDPVLKAEADARKRCSLPDDAKVIVHTNMYDVDAYVAPHADVASLKDSPILSYTLVRNSMPRRFQIYDKRAYDDLPKGKRGMCPVHREHELEDGSLLIMGGTMQSHYKHGVKAITTPRDKETWGASRRINMTVRFVK